MAFGVFIYKKSSKYDDYPEKRYNFPKQYLKTASELVNCWIVYYEPTTVKNASGYFALAKVVSIEPDVSKPKMFNAIIEPGTYLEFPYPVPFKINSTYVESGLLNESGKPSGRAQLSIREVSSQDFGEITRRGLGLENNVFDGYDPIRERERFEQKVNRIIRDKAFRSKVLLAYQNQCCMTGSRFTNGGSGIVEVEAAHIQPVKHNGPDCINNGLALSRTVHWMFDNGLVGLSKDYEILVSSRNNDPDAIYSYINNDRRLILPKSQADLPGEKYIDWHYNHCFKR